MLVDITKIEQIIEPAIVSEGVELVGAELKSDRGILVLRVYIDKEGGVTLDDCENVSRMLGPLLDAEGIIRKKYNLEVSSPGLTREIKKLQEYKKFCGRLVKIKTYEAIEGVKVFNGVLKSCSDEFIEVESGKKTVKVPFSKIAKANLDFKF